MATRRRGVFAVTVFLCCFVNYYFFVGQVTFTLIYFFLRLLTRSFRINLRDFLMLFCEAVVGVLMSCVLLVPTILAVVQNPRVEDVYKRQLRIFSAFPPTSRPAPPRQRGRARRADRACRPAQPRQGIKTVSYTHLDVYKRPRPYP